MEKQDDLLRNLALETLLELCFVDPAMVKQCHGIRLLVGLLQDYSSFSLASIILDTILQLLETKKTRIFILEDFNVAVLGTAFSDTNTKTSMNIEKMQNASILISKVLKSYNGIMLYSMNNFQPLKELLSFLHVPLCAPYLVDIFLDVVRIKPLPYKSKVKHSFKPIPSQFHKECMSINQHMALLITILENCNFVDYFVQLLSFANRDEFHKSVMVKSRYLLIEYLNLKMNLVDGSVTKVSKPVLKSEETLFEETFEFSKISYTLNRNRNMIGLTDIDYNENIKSFSQNIKENTLVNEIDDSRFRKMVFDTKVLQTKEFSEWNWNIIQELIEGPLMNPKQLEELAKSTKFVRRLLVFYRPLRLRFSSVDKGVRLSSKYIQVGCKFFKMLTTNPEGIKIFKEDNKIIPQLASLLYRAIEGNVAGNIFNEANLKHKMIQGYFKFIGVLTQTAQGVKILSRWNFFTVIYKMFQFENRLALHFLLLTIPEIDLKHSSHCRTIMGKASFSGV